MRTGLAISVGILIGTLGVGAMVFATMDPFREAPSRNTNAELKAMVERGEVGTTPRAIPNSAYVPTTVYPSQHSSPRIKAMDEDATNAQGDDLRAFVDDYAATYQQ